jgi:hypothetical protein
MKSWNKPIEEFDLTPVNVSPLTRGKNATDRKLTIEAMDMMHGRQLDGICIASSDGDFTPLAARIRARAVAAYGFGAKKAPKGYKDEFDRFYECDTLLAAERSALTAEKHPAKSRRRQPKGKVVLPTATTPATLPAKPGKSEVPVVQVLAAIDAAMGEDKRAHMRGIGNRLARTMPNFSSKTYGYRTNTDLVRALPGIELTKEGNETYVRRKPE